MFPPPRRGLAHRATSSGRAITVWALAISMAFITHPAAAEDYRLQPGDVLEFNAAGLPDMKQRVHVDVDGAASFPLIGEIPVAGMRLAEVRDELKRLLPKKSLAIRSRDGQEHITVISGDELMISVAEYRPVYVSGDVAKPGEQPFRAGLTVRQAVALSGGYDIQRFRMEDPVLASADLRGEYESQWAELLKLQAAAARLQAELAWRDTFDPAAVPDAPLPKSVIQGILDTEQKLLRSRADDARKEQQHLRDMVKLADERIKVMKDQFVKEDEGAKLDESEIERVAELQRRGVVPITRAIEARRLSLLSTTRALQLSVEIEKEGKDRVDSIRSIDRFADQRRTALLQEVRDNEVAQAQVRARLQATGEKLLYSGVVRSQLVRGSGGKPSFVVYRAEPNSDRRVEIAADESTTLRPGDTIEVALRLEYEFRPNDPGTAPKGSATP